MRSGWVGVGVGDLWGFGEGHVVVAAGGGEREQILAGDEPVEWHGHIGDVSELVAEADRAELIAVESYQYHVIEVVVDALQDELDLGIVSLWIETANGQRLTDGIRGDDRPEEVL